VSEAADPATVLVVDDEEEVADSYSLFLEREYEVRTAYGGQEALRKMDRDVDVVVLDRRMPKSGDEVLAELRDAGFDCRVVMVTAVGAELDIVDMDFDEYVRKPVSGIELTEVVEEQLAGPGRDDPEAEFLRIAAKLSTLADEQPESELEDSAEYARLRERARDLRDELDAPPERFDDLLSSFSGT
jgi:DNA-binding response OmpR family regulator